MLKYFSESFLCISLWHITSTSCRHMPATKTTTKNKHYVWWAHCWLALVGIVRELRVDVSFAKMRLPRRYSSVRITVTLARLNAVALWSIAIAVLCSQQKHSSILVECVWYAYEISLDQIRTANVALAVEVVLITSHTYTMRIYGDYPLLLTSHSEWRWQYVDLAVYACMAYMSVVHVPIAGTDKRVPHTTHPPPSCYTEYKSNKYLSAVCAFCSAEAHTFVQSCLSPMRSVPVCCVYSNICYSHHCENQTRS